MWKKKMLLYYVDVDDVADIESITYIHTFFCVV
jgi:hypothetical protein